MAIDVRTLTRTPLALSGRTRAGAVSNTKTMVQGDIDITVYTSEGEPLVPADLGLTNIDFITFEILDVDGGVGTITSHLVATYDYTAEQLLLWDGNLGVTVPASSGQVRFLAFGDSAAAPDLT